MRLRVTVETTSPNGTRDVRSEDYTQDAITIGRGAGSTILLDNHSVSFSHAKLFQSARGPVLGTGVIIEDTGSLSGVLVNKVPTRAKELCVGDVITLGTVSFTVRDADGVLELFRELKNESLDLESKIRRDVQELHLARKLPSFQLVSLILIALVLVGFFIYPVATERKAAWSSGPIASGHTMVEQDCRTCHEGVFARITDKKCAACHQMSDHSEVFAFRAGREAGVEPSCSSCHFDHNGPHGVIARQSKLCTNCHAKIDTVLASVRRSSVGSKGPAIVPEFDQHPEFAVTLQPESPGAIPQRVRLDEPARLKDVSNIKLNHKVHLQPNLRSRKGKKSLDCQDCHRVSNDYRTITPISFEANCQECHSLEFDERLPGVEVPHGSPDVVFRTLYSEYAKLLLSSEATSPSRKEFQQRGGRIPGKASPAQVAEEVEAKSGDDFSRGFVEQESRSAERGLFSRTACYLCHAVSERRLPEAQLREQGKSRFEVLKPQIPARWMPASTFSHGSHEEAQCESCHTGVRQSARTADVLLPKIETCRECHSQHRVVGKVTSDCVMCHSYHESQTMPDERKRPINEIVARLKL